MRIVGLKEFMDLPCPVLYCDFKPNHTPDGNWYIKLGNIGDNDWSYDIVGPGEIEHSGSSDLWDKYHQCEQDSSVNFPMDFDGTRRYGMYPKEGEVLFAVYDAADTQALIDRFQEHLAQI